MLYRLGFRVRVQVTLIYCCSSIVLFGRLVSVLD